jgi:hypothetical protein
LRHRVSALGFAIIVAFAGALGAGGAANAAPAGANILYADSPNAVADRYIVVFKDCAVPASTVGAKARDLAGRFGGRARHVYTAGLRGFSVGMTAAQARKLAADPAVASVEAVQRIGVLATQAAAALPPLPF